MVNDTISDMFIRIKNAYAVGKPSLTLPASKMKEAVAQVLKEAHYIENVTREEGAPCDNLIITLRYIGKEPAVTHLKRVSTPGLRRYSKVESIPRPLSGHGLVIISTPQGVMSGANAQKQGLGGEVIATVW